MIYRASHQSPVPRKVAPIREFLSNLPFGSTPLFSEDMLNAYLLPSRLKAFFGVRYWLDPNDCTGAIVSDISIIVLTRDCQNVFCTVCDLRDYAALARSDATPYDYEQDLPIAFREDTVTPLVPDIPKRVVEDASGEDLLGAHLDIGLEKEE